MERRGSWDASRAARVAGNPIDDPSSDTRSLGAPAAMARKFQPVYVASGTATSGRRMPARSSPSASTCGTRSGSGAPPPAPPGTSGFGTRAPADTLFGDCTPGIDGNATADAGVSVWLASVGYALAGGAVPALTHRCIASSSARIVHQ